MDITWYAPMGRLLIEIYCYLSPAHSSVPYVINFFSFSFFFLVGLEFEFRASRLQSRHSTA
jgi:hypothetical protein